MSLSQISAIIKGSANRHGFPENIAGLLGVPGATEINPVTNADDPTLQYVSDAIANGILGATGGQYVLYSSNISDFAATITALGSTPATIYINSQVPITNDLDIAALAPNTSIVGMRGGGFVVSATKTVNFKSFDSFGLSIGDMFSGAGAFAFAYPTRLTGTGSPESAITAPVGSEYLRSDGGAAATLYVKESGTGNTGWVVTATTVSGGGYKTVDSIADLKTLSEGSFKTVTVLGYYSANGVGSGLYSWDAASTIADNGGTIISPTISDGTGRWILIQNTPIKISQFGARGVTATEDSPAFVAACGSFSGGEGGLVIDVDVKMNAHLSSPSNVSIIPLKGAMFSGPYTLTINSLGSDPNFQWIGSDVSVIFGRRATHYVMPQWFGAGTTLDDIAAIEKAIYAASNGGQATGGVRSLFLPPSDYFISRGIDLKTLLGISGSLVAQGYFTIWGINPGSTRIIPCENIVGGMIKCVNAGIGNAANARQLNFHGFSLYSDDTLNKTAQYGFQLKWCAEVYLNKFRIMNVATMRSLFHDTTFVCDIENGTIIGCDGSQGDPGTDEPDDVSYAFSDILQTFTVSNSGGSILLTYASDLPDQSAFKFTTSSALPIGLTAGVEYWIDRINATSCKVSTSLANAIAHTNIAYTDAGTGTHTLTVQDKYQSFTASNSGGSLLLTFQTGMPNLSVITVSNIGGGLPGGLSASTEYWLDRVTTTTCKVSTSEANAIAHTNIAYSSAGTGTHKCTVPKNYRLTGPYFANTCTTTTMNTCRVNNFRIGINLANGDGMEFHNTAPESCVDHGGWISGSTANVSFTGEDYWEGNTNGNLLITARCDGLKFIGQFLNGGAYGVKIVGAEMNACEISGGSFKGIDGIVLDTPVIHGLSVHDNHFEVDNDELVYPGDTLNTYGSFGHKLEWYNNTTSKTRNRFERSTKNLNLIDFQDWSKNLAPTIAPSTKKSKIANAYDVTYPNQNGFFYQELIGISSSINQDLLGSWITVLLTMKYTSIVDISQAATASNSGGDLLLTYAADFPDLSIVTYTTTGTPIGNLVSGSTYCLKRQSAATAKVGATYDDVDGAGANVYIAYSSAGTGTHTFTFKEPGGKIRISDGVNDREFLIGGLALDTWVTRRAYVKLGDSATSVTARLYPNGALMTVENMVILKGIHADANVSDAYHSKFYMRPSTAGGVKPWKMYQSPTSNVVIAYIDNPGSPSYGAFGLNDSGGDPGVYLNGGTGQILSHNAAGGIGYSTGAGGTVTQTTSKSTGVTLSKVTGQITMNNAALAANTSVSFTLTNSAIAATDVLNLNFASGATPGAYTWDVQCGAGSAVITITNRTGGSLSEAIVIAFVLFKGATS